jgi:hypothetical protein
VTKLLPTGELPSVTAHAQALGFEMPDEMMAAAEALRREQRVR